jgi:hypothetical protein
MLVGPLIWCGFNQILSGVCFAQKLNEKKEASEKKYYEGKNFVNGE